MVVFFLGTDVCGRPTGPPVITVSFKRRVGTFQSPSAMTP